MASITTETAMEKKKSQFISPRSTGMAAAMLLSPVTIRRLNMLEPMTLPRAIPLLPASAAVTLTASSGALVPKATTVRPMTAAGTRSSRAADALPSTKRSAPFTSSTNPTISHIKIVAISNSTSSQLVSPRFPRKPG